MGTNKIIEVDDLGFLWETQNPFLFCAHHKDDFPKGNSKLGPEEAYLKHRNLGNDFTIKDGFRMYHGKKIPGFPEHPHRGFETVTVVLEGFVDHSDSKGASGRYGNGDVQWMTAGAGMQHAEMFPLVHEDKENSLDLFQIWLNLPKKDKFCEPYYKMLWAEDIPIVEVTDKHGKKSFVRLISGEFKKYVSLEPAPNSWANHRKNHVGIYFVTVEPEAIFDLPEVSKTLSRNVYFYTGDTMEIEGTMVRAGHRIQLDGNSKIEMVNGTKESQLLILEGEPINEQVVQYGPFVMNSEKEIQDAYADYQRTEFGGWPWKTSDPVHDVGPNRFAKYADGTQEDRSVSEDQKKG